MKSKLFKLVGTTSPMVHIYRRGQVDLSQAPDNVLIDIYTKGCRYLEPTEEGLKALAPAETPKPQKATEDEPAETPPGGKSKSK